MIGAGQDTEMKSVPLDMILTDVPSGTEKIQHRFEKYQEQGLQTNNKEKLKAESRNTLY